MTATEFIPAHEFNKFNERHSDVGNARWFSRLYGEQVRWIRERGKWITNVGTHWAEDADGEVERMAKIAVDAMLAGQRDVPRDAREALFKHVLRSEQAPRIAAMLSLAKSEIGITLAEAELDRDPMVLGVHGGAIHLRTGKFFVPKATDYITRQAACQYNPHAKAPLWCSFLDRIFDGDIAMVSFLQRALGYCLTGDANEQCLFVAHGPGANGKSVLLSTINALLGDYAMSAPITTFVDRRGDAASNDLARLAGARIVSATEAEEGRRLAEGLIKVLTGGEKVAARFLFREYFEFTVGFKVWIATNHKPSIRGDDHAIWRRIRLVPFPVTIPASEQDHNLAEKLRQELPGILNWAIAGCLAWQADGLQPPAAVLDATEAYRSEQDRLGAWINENCIVTSGVTEQAATLYGNYSTWSEARGERAMTMTSFGRRLGDRGFDKSKTGTVRYQGITLRGDSGRLEGLNQFSLNALSTPSRGHLSENTPTLHNPPDSAVDDSAKTDYLRASRGE